MLVFIRHRKVYMTGKTQSVTIRDIAKLSNVSVATVSRFINKSATVSPDVAKRIQRVMDEMNYKPHLAARHLATHSAQTIGLVLRYTLTEYFAPLLDGIEAVAAKNQYNLLITTEKSFERTGDQPPIGPHNTDGILAFANCMNDAQLKKLWDGNFPLTLIHRTPPAGLNIPYVAVENELVTGKIIDHLIERHNRESILFLRGIQDHEDFHWREKGYRDSLKKHGIPIDPNLIADGGFSGNAAYKAIKQILMKKQIHFDSVFSGNDDAAIGVITALSEAGLRVPEDVSIVGFDDLRFSAFLNPPLTTVRAPTEEVGRIAAQLLFDQINNLPVESVTLSSSEIVFRRSCGCTFTPT